jgi:DNA-binding transcriptional ArsR family regulator
MDELLTPSLWRSCRALANKNRLLLLKGLIDQPSRTVDELADEINKKACTCSQWLRLLNSRGLLRVSREGRWVRYSIGTDPAVKHAQPLMKALCAALRKCRVENDYDAVLKDLTIFTHPRRILLVKTIHTFSKARAVDLQRRCKFSEEALFRHLSKLLRRGAVVKRDDGYAVHVPNRILARTLLELVLQE